MRKREARRKRQKNHAGNRESWAARRERKRREHVGNHVIVESPTPSSTETSRVTMLPETVVNIVDRVAASARPLPSILPGAEADRFVQTGSHR